MKGKRLGGRKAGTPNKKTIARLATVQRALAEGVTPLDVLLEVMQQHYARWKTPPEGQDALETIKAAELAKDAARDAAPYIHARLQAIEHKAELPIPTELSKMEFLRRVIFLAREAKEAEKEKHLRLVPALPRDDTA